MLLSHFFALVCLKERMPVHRTSSRIPEILIGY